MYPPLGALFWEHPEVDTEVLELFRRYGSH
jgi:hypothetical protein